MMKNKLDLLIDKARILGLTYDNTIPDDLRAIYHTADNIRRPLSAVELEKVCSFSGIDSTPIQHLQEKAPAIVTAVKKRLLAEEPELIQIGGALYPEVRAQACWRDCWHFLRIAIYALAADRTEFTHRPGVNGLGDLYRELNVPIASMARALSHLRNESVACYSAVGGSRDAWRLDQALLHLEEMLKDLSLIQTPGPTLPT
jgi:hypothetical protein